MGTVTFRWLVQRPLTYDEIHLTMIHIPDPETYKMGDDVFYATKVLATPEQLNAWETFPEVRSIEKESMKLALLDHLEMPWDTEVLYDDRD